MWGSSKIKDILERESRDHMIDSTKNGKCSRCGGCCTCLLPISEGELRNIKTYVKRNNVKPVHHTDKSENNLDLLCPFLTETGCTIYPARPAICKSFICNKGDEKIKRDRDRFHHKYDFTNLWESVYMEFDHSFDVRMVDGTPTVVKSADLMEAYR